MHTRKYDTSASVGSHGDNFSLKKPATIHFRFSHEESRMESQPQQAVSSNDTLVLVGQRASPINSLECEHLTKLVQNEIILDNESTDGKVMAMKKLAWERVALHFNAAGYCEKRTVYQLQKVWGAH